MTRVEFIEWIEAHDCKQLPFDGVNHTGRQIKYVNERYNTYMYMDLPIDDRKTPDYLIIHACNKLHIPHPDCVDHEKPRLDEIENKFGKNKEAS